jgi:transposase
VFLRCHRRKKDGKIHRYWSIVESRRTSRGPVQRHVLYLGEINDSQLASWEKAITVFDERDSSERPLALYPDDRPLPDHARQYGVSIRLDALSIRRPRQWGACWLALELWRELRLDSFWVARLGSSLEGTHWETVLAVLVTYRLIDPGSEWRLHRHWFEHTALADLLGGDFSLAAKDTLYRCHDRLLDHKEALFSHLHDRWRDLFNTTHEVLLYDLTSTYFESDPPFPEGDKRRHGYSRDHRSDCVQIVIALVITPEGFPLAYEVLPGNTIDNQTLRAFLGRIERQYGKARRIWLMDRGIPTEEVLDEMKRSDPPTAYLVGTPKGRLTKLEADLATRPWQQAREGVEVKLLKQDQETYVLARSRDRVAKERAMRRRRLRRLLNRLKELSTPSLRPRTRDNLLKAIGAAEKEAGKDGRHVLVTVDEKPDGTGAFAVRYQLDRQRLRRSRRQEGSYLLRTNLVGKDPAELWNQYMRLVEVEEAFRNLKGDLGIRPIWHRDAQRIEAHVFVSFLAYCLQVSLKVRLERMAPGLTPRSVLEKLGQMQMVDVHVPTSDGRELVMSRYTEPSAEQRLLMDRLRLALPEQPRPKITNPQVEEPPSPKM